VKHNPTAASGASQNAAAAVPTRMDRRQRMATEGKSIDRVLVLELNKSPDAKPVLRQWALLDADGKVCVMGFESLIAGDPIAAAAAYRLGQRSVTEPRQPVVAGDGSKRP
jgi:hypothetical protein